MSWENNMKPVIKILTLIFALFWLIFGLNGFLHFFPTPEPNPTAATLMAALDNSGYIMPLTYAMEIIGGILLLIPRFRFLALLLLAPVTLNIVLYDFFLNPGGLAIGAVIAAIHALLLWDRRNRLCSLIGC